MFYSENCLRAQDTRGSKRHPSAQRVRLLKGTLRRAPGVSFGQTRPSDEAKIGQKPNETLRWRFLHLLQTRPSDEKCVSKRPPSAKTVLPPAGTIQIEILIFEQWYKIFADPRRVLNRLGGKVSFPPTPLPPWTPPIFRRLLQTTPSGVFVSSKRTPPSVFDAGARKNRRWGLCVACETRFAN